MHVLVYKDNADDAVISEIVLEEKMVGLWRMGSPCFALPQVPSTFSVFPTFFRISAHLCYGRFLSQQGCWR